ncbi:MAG: IS3-like element ISSpn11 family transposase, partial [Culicoidibacterales bacterium]
MAKLTKEQRVEMYTRYKAGEAISQLAHVYKINSSNVRYLVKLINHHGIEILDNKSNTYYDPNTKKQIINKVLIEGKTIYQ